MKYKEGHIFHGPYGDVLFIKRLGYKVYCSKNKNKKLKNKRHLGLFRCFCGKEFEHTIQRVYSCGCGQTYNRKPYGESLYNSATTKIIAHIKRRGIELSVSKEYINELIRKPCHYCGEIGSNISTNKSTLCKSLKHNGIDRIDSKKGYIEGNCVPCCKRCNWAKNDMTIDEFKKHIKKLYFFMIKNATIDNA